MKFDILKMVFNSVLPHLDNASIVWARCPNMINNDRMSKLQKRAAMVVLRYKIRDVSSDEHFNMMKWMLFYDSHI